MPSPRARGRGFAVVFPIAATLLLGLSTGALPASAQAPQPGHAAEPVPLPPGIYPLRSTLPGTGDDDLQVFDELFEGARIIGLGEATHGTAELVHLRWRLIEYLAEHHRVRLVLLEDDLHGVRALDRFAVEGVGDPHELVVTGNDWGQGWGKAVQEQVEVLLWARELNRRRAAEGKAPIRFAGIDSKRLARSMDAVVETVRGLEIPDAPALAEGIATAYAPHRALDAESLVRSMASAALAVPLEPGADEAGTEVELTGRIRTKGLERGWAGMQLRFEDPDKRTLAVVDLQEDGPHGTTDWTRHSLTAALPAGTHRVVVLIYSVGTGSARFDDLRLSPWDLRWDERLATEEIWRHVPSHRLTVEAPGPRPAGEGARRDPAHSVHIEYQPTAIDRALDTAREVHGELRQRLEGLGSPPARDALQYARMVIQGLEFRDLHASRDEAMAENARWWLDGLSEGSETRAVLVGHNSHIGRRGNRLGKIGDFLDDWYGSSYRPLAMTTGGGTYLAEEDHRVETSRRGAFPLPPPPEGSVEALLATLHDPARGPGLVIDLREATLASPGGPLAAPRPLRGIGLTHSEDQFREVDLPAVFDGLIYLDTTRATRLLAPPAPTP